MKPRPIFLALAQVFDYPGDDYQQAVASCQQLLHQQYPDAAARFLRFSDHMAAIVAEQCEEIYAKTFHIQAICYLDLGYVIFGEDYKRGEFLVHMQAEQAKLALDCGSELPDNLANVLRLMAYTPDHDFLQELAMRVVHPALKTMVAEFEDARQQLKIKILKKLHKALIQQDIDGGNVYRNALEAIMAVLEHEFAGISYEDAPPQPSIGGSFLKQCGPSGCSTDALQSPVKQDLSVGML